MTANPAVEHPDEALTLRVLRLRPGARLPQRQTALASGYDLHACLQDGPLTVGETPVRVPTGIAVAAAPGLDVQVRPRSGLSARGVMAVFGTLDADYRGEVMVTLYCLPAVGAYEVQDGDRIAQLVVSRLVDVAWEPVDTLDDTARGAGGHGSTGRR
jgi:dUTP pyrophosphatase